MRVMHRTSAAVRRRSNFSVVWLVIAAGMVLLSVNAELAPEAAAASPGANRFVVVIDPAHGGADLGSRFSALVMAAERLAEVLCRGFRPA